MTREEVLQAAAKCVNGDRQEDYGSPENNFGMVAVFWNAYLQSYMCPNSIGIDSKDVAAMLGLLKTQFVWILRQRISRAWSPMQRKTRWIWSLSPRMIPLSSVWWTP